MTDRKWLLAGFFVLCFSLSPLWAVEDTDRPEGETDKPKRKKIRMNLGPRGEYNIMSSVLNLNDEQKAKLEEKAKAMAEWQTKFRKVREASSNARKAGDKKTRAKTHKQMRELLKERNQIITKHDAELMAMLTYEQKTKWEGFKLYRSVMRGFGRADLSKEQKDTVRQICNAKAKELVQLQKDNVWRISQLKDPEAVKKEKRQARIAEAKFRDTVSDKVYKNILTEQQRKKLDTVTTETRPIRRNKKSQEPDNSDKE